MWYGGGKVRTVSPFRARSKRRAASSRAAGGRLEGSDGVVVGGWTAPFVLASSSVGGGDVVFCWAAEAADWP